MHFANRKDPPVLANDEVQLPGSPGSPSQTLRMLTLRLFGRLVLIYDTKSAAVDPRGPQQSFITLCGEGGAHPNVLSREGCDERRH